jgi:hypothetical protein
MLRSSTRLEHGPRLPVQRQWNTWLLLAGVVAACTFPVGNRDKVVEVLEVLGLVLGFQLLLVQLIRLL